MPGIGIKYKASSLIEVLVAMIIILICAGLGMTAISNLSRDMNGNVDMEGEVYLNKIVNDTKTDKDYTDKTFEFTGIRVERSILPCKKEKRLKILHIVVYNTVNRKVAEVKEIIKIEP